MNARARRMLVVNFGGIGNGIVLLPILKRLEESAGEYSYYVTDNPVLRSELPDRIGLRRLLGIAPAAWRRFDRGDWTDIDAFIERHRIDLIVNLRNEGPLRDRGYFAFKQAAPAGIEFWDLDQAVLCGRVAGELLADDLVRMLAEHGLDLRPIDVAWLRRLVGPRRRSRTPSVAFFTGSSQRVKCLPAASWIELGRRLLADTRYRIVIYAGRQPWELELAAALAKELDHPARCRLVSGLPLERFCRALADHDIMVSNDTAAVHIASALDVPTVGLYSATDPRIWGGWGRRFIPVESQTGRQCPSRKVDAGNCEFFYGGCPAPCTEDITTRQILSAIERLQPEFQSPLAPIAPLAEGAAGRVETIVPL